MREAGEQHGHVHHPHSGGGRHLGLARGGKGPDSKRRLLVSLIFAALIMLAEAVGGWLSGSLALLSDAGHMLTDVAALALALLAVLFSQRPADARRTFGFRRLEVLAAQVNAATLFALTGYIAWEAVNRLRSPPAHIVLGVMAGVAAFGLLGNSIILLWLRGDHNLNTRSAFLHVMGDAVASLAVLLGALVIWVHPAAKFVDPVLSLFIALLILWGAAQLVIEISEILMEAAPRHLDVQQIARAMEEADGGVIAVHDLHVWTISSGLYALSAHLVIRAENMGRNDAILTGVKTCLRSRYGIDHTTLQIESVAYVHIDDVHHH
ncbi:MAG TPA: cation diffusion facilitator family transporter [Anaeromyxobacteraceae bacterium]|nr:cation diffusion facilitator family transporter [Anaeromyxobacteraceae bacterium]